MRLLQSALSALAVGTAGLWRGVRPGRHRPVAAGYADRVRRAERDGDEPFLDAELARLQPTAESLRRTARPSPPVAAWPDEDLQALFGPDVAAATRPAE